MLFIRHALYKNSDRWKVKCLKRLCKHYKKAHVAILISDNILQDKERALSEIRTFQNDKILISWKKNNNLKYVCI